MKAINSPPQCCYQASVWVYHSPALMYYLCTKCKKEVKTHELHFLSERPCYTHHLCKAIPPCYGSEIAVHHWKDTVQYKKEVCNCGKRRIY